MANDKNSLAGCYIRVSTSEQSTDMQKRELLGYLKARGWSLYKIYEDKASGTTDDRPQLKQLMADARQRKFDIVLCWKLDRFFRSLKNLVNSLQEFQDLGIQFVSLKDNIDMTTASGRLLTHVIGAMAEFEATLIRERVRAGLANARLKGKRLGRPLQRDDLNIATLKQRGLSYRQIANTIGMSVGAVQRSLRGVSKSPPVGTQKSQ